MFKSSPPYAIWSVWMYLPLLQKLLFLSVCVLGIYSLFSSALTVMRLHTIGNTPNKDIASIQGTLAALRKRSGRLQQFVGAAFYLFGVLLFVGLQWAYVTAANTEMPVGWFVLENLLIYFAFAANVFFIFLIIHFVQWFTSARVDAYALRLHA